MDAPTGTTRLWNAGSIPAGSTTNTNVPSGITRRARQHGWSRCSGAACSPPERDVVFLIWQPGTGDGEGSTPSHATERDKEEEHTMKTKQDTGKCQATVQTKTTRGIMAKGTESFGYRWNWCPKDAVEGGSFCMKHQRANEELQRKLEAKRAREARRAQ